MGQNAPLGLLAKSGRKTSFIPLRDVMYIEHVGRKCRIVTVNGDILVPQSPASLLNGPVGAVFIHCPQSYWINILVMYIAQLYTNKIRDLLPPAPNKP